MTIRSFCFSPAQIVMKIEKSCFPANLFHGMQADSKPCAQKPAANKHL